MMLITVIVDLESIIEWVVLGAIIIICILILIVGAIADGISGRFGERKRKKQYEEYDRKFGEGSEADVDSGVDTVGGGNN